MLVVEPARNQDAQALAELAARTLSETFAPEWLSAHMAPRNACFVARDVPSNRVVGFALAERSGPEAHLLALAVDAQTREKGVGTNLVKTVGREMGRDGAWRMALEVRADNPSAQQFYARLGFVPEGLKEGVYRDGGSAVQMARPL